MMLEALGLLFMLMGYVALLIVAAVALVVCDRVIRRAMLDAARAEALRQMRAEQLMQARRERWEERKRQQRELDGIDALIKAASDPIFVSSVRKNQRRSAFGIPVWEEAHEGLRPAWTCIDELDGEHMDTKPLYQQVKSAGCKHQVLRKRLNVPDYVKDGVLDVGTDSPREVLDAEAESARVDIVAEEVDSYADV